MKIIKNFLKCVDKLVFFGFMLNMFDRLCEIAISLKLESTFEHKISIYSHKNNNSQISMLCDLFGSDKSSLKLDGHIYEWSPHTYEDIYSRLFHSNKSEVKNVFECGIGSSRSEISSSMGPNAAPGASLLVWRELFPNANIYGADIDRSILFTGDRIQTFELDQLNEESIKALWIQLSGVEFDLMIDDGLHTFEAGATLFKHSISKLSRNGVYVIEDVGLNALKKYVEFFKGSQYLVDFVCLRAKGVVLSDNNLIIVRCK